MSAEISGLRRKIDEIDGMITELFERRMAVAMDIAKYKDEHDLPVINIAREREILARVTENQDDEMSGYTKTLFTTLFDLSKSYQGGLLLRKLELAGDIRKAAAGTPALFPKRAVVACQGAEGANSQLACDRLFHRSKIIYVNSFDAVFTAVEQGFCNYGMLPIENSLYGSVLEVYDLMRKYKFFIARSIKQKIEHTLLARQGARLSGIREVFSHEQALGQCREFLSGLKDVKLTICENTAVAAQMVSDSERTDIAAVAGKVCGELYGLTVMADGIQDNDNNYTRFICISKELEIYPGSDKISVMFTLPHRPGALYGIISKFASRGVNLTKLESRPIPGKDFEFMFYADLEADIGDEAVLKLLASLEGEAEKFVFLGSYSEK